MNNTTLKLKAVFFDMDGVLFDSMKNHAVAWVKAMKTVGLPFTEYEAYLNEGRTGASTIDNVFIRECGRHSTEEEKQQIYRLKSEFFEKEGHTERMPYALDLLEKIHSQQIEIFLVTGSGQVSLLDKLDTNFPGFFHKDKMVTAYDVHHGKPHPEPYLTALKKSGYSSEEVLVVENAPLGVQSATSAGLFTIAVNTGPLEPSVLTDSGADLIFDSMKDLYQKWDSVIEKFAF